MTDDIKGKYIGHTFAHRCVFIDGINCDYNAEIEISEQMITKVSLYDVTRNVFDAVKDKDEIVLCLKKDEKYITIITSYLLQSSFRQCSGVDEKETGVTLKYVSSRLLYGYDCREKEITFNSFSFEITDGMELLGEYPFEHSIVGDARDMSVVSNGKLIYRDLKDGFSYFVVPVVEKKKEGLLLKYQYKFQYQGEEKYDLDYLGNCLRQIIAFFEILCGETISVNGLSLISEESYSEYVGVNNFQKNQLKCLSNGFDTTSFLRKSVFKLSDFNDIGVGIIGKFQKIERNNYLAFESYKQVLLDEEVKIVTYNKFLKVMQIIEGYRRSDEDEKAIKEFENTKRSILDKLDDIDKSFIEKYTKYNGETFRKCLGKFTYDAIKVLSGLSKTKAKDKVDGLVSRIIYDRDVYTHASKKHRPCLGYDELEYVIECYKMFFRVLILHQLGLSEDLIRSRLYYNRTFVNHYQRLFGLSLTIDEKNMSTDDFDMKMWGYDK